MNSANVYYPRWVPLLEQLRDSFWQSAVARWWQGLMAMLQADFGSNRASGAERGTGDASAGSLNSRFETLLRSHGDLISRLCFSYAVDGDDYQDLRQDALLNIWKGLAGFRGDASSVTWVYRVVLNTCVSTLRKRGSRPNMERLDNMPLDFPDTADDDGMRERLETLHRLISELTPVDKAIVTMWLDERTYEEIAEVTGVTKNNVGLRLHRIRERWRNQENKMN